MSARLKARAVVAKYVLVTYLGSRFEAAGDLTQERGLVTVPPYVMPPTGLLIRRLHA